MPFNIMRLTKPTPIPFDTFVHHMMTAFAISIDGDLLDVNWSYCDGEPRLEVTDGDRSIAYIYAENTHDYAIYNGTLEATERGHTTADEITLLQRMHASV